MIVDVEVPVQGLTVTEATLVRWLKQIGETVAKGESIFEIETDKAAQEIESPGSGTVLAHLAAEGDVIPLGKVIAKLGTEASDHYEAAAPVASAVAPQPPITGESGAVRASAARSTPSTAYTPSATAPPSSTAARPSPRARRAAERLGVDLALVPPTGARGAHIRERDVLLFAEGMSTVPAPAPARGVEPDRIRRITAERTAASFRDTPHFYVTREVNAEPLVALREQLVTRLEEIAGVRLTITDLLVKALALTIQAFPAFNAQWIDGRIVTLDSIDISLAVDTPKGLIVPVLRGVDRQPIVEVARQRADIASRAKAGQIRGEELSGGSFTLSNMGTLDVDHFEAVINPPQSGILAVGSIKVRPFVIDGQLVACRTMHLTVSADHRLVDGADTARFLAHLAGLVESPLLLCAL